MRRRAGRAGGVQHGRADLRVAAAQLRDENASDVGSGPRVDFPRLADVLLEQPRRRHPHALQLRLVVDQRRAVERGTLTDVQVDVAIADEGCGVSPHVHRTRVQRAVERVVLHQHHPLPDGGDPGGEREEVVGARLAERREQREPLFVVPPGHPRGPFRAVGQRERHLRRVPQRTGYGQYLAALADDRAGPDGLAERELHDPTGGLGRSLLQREHGDRRRGGHRRWSRRRCRRRGGRWCRCGGVRSRWRRRSGRRWRWRGCGHRGGCGRWRRRGPGWCGGRRRRRLFFPGSVVRDDQRQRKDGCKDDQGWDAQGFPHSL